MKRILSILLFATLSFTQEKARVAVLDFEGVEDALVISNAVRSELVKSDKYQIISRSDIAKIIQEQQFQLSGMVDEETSVELGRILGAQHLVTGSVTKVGISYFLNVKMVNIESGEISASESVKAMSINSLSKNGVKKVSKSLLKSAEKIIIETEETEIVH